MKSMKFNDGLEKKVCTWCSMLLDIFVFLRDLLAKDEYTKIHCDWYFDIVRDSGFYFFLRPFQVDMSKVNVDTVKPWIAQRVTELLGIEDDVLVEFVYNQLEPRVRF